MTAFQIVLALALLGCSALTVIFCGALLYLNHTGQDHRLPGLEAASTLVLSQTSLLLGVADHSWWLTLFGLICFLMMVVAIVAKGRNHAAA
ncbi:hypothetical protein [Lacticaseibacillus jixiensis]|uniref:hypothetical protein n=1 Tax=Lacticaseibacillus jixiensis TaxID=3231926 RepID=UPI0036F29004